MSCVCCVVPLSEWRLSFHINFTKHRPSFKSSKLQNESQENNSHREGNTQYTPWNPSYLGDQLKTLCGHTTSTELSSCPGNPYFVSNAVMDKEESFRVWEKASLRCLASFKLDSYVRRLYSLCICLTLSNIRIVWLVHLFYIV